MPLDPDIVIESNEDQERDEGAVKNIEEVIRPPTHDVREHTEYYDSDHEGELVLELEEGL